MLVGQILLPTMHLLLPNPRLWAVGCGLWAVVNWAF